MLSTQTKTVIFISAIVSGLLNYAGLSLGIPSDDWWMLTLCALTGLVVTLIISAFWNHAFAVVPDLTTGATRLRGWGAVLAGVALILMVSTYWNLVAISGNTVTQELGKGIVTNAETRLAEISETGTAYQSYLSDLTALRASTAAIRDREIAGTGVSPTAGEGPISDTMGQTVDVIGAIVDAVEAASGNVSDLQTEGTACLGELRGAVSAADMDAAGEALACINRVGAEISGQDVLSTMERSLRNLSAGITLPSGIRTDAQRSAVASFLAGRQAQADRIADQIASEQTHELEPLTMERPNLIQGVILHWKAIIPAIATALSIDLLPLVLLIFATLRADDQASKGQPRGTWTAAELQDAVLQAQMICGKPCQPFVAAPQMDLPPMKFIDLDESEWRDNTDDAGGEE